MKEGIRRDAVNDSSRVDPGEPEQGAGGGRGFVAGPPGRTRVLDHWIVVGILVVAVAGMALARGWGSWGFGGRRVPAAAEVRAGNDVVGVWRLDAAGARAAGGPPGRVSAPGPLGDTVIEFRGGRVRVLSSPCPDKICVKTGWRFRPGDVIACLPNRVIVSIRAVRGREGP